jgi:hypothetical protein
LVIAGNAINILCAYAHLAAPQKMTSVCKLLGAVLAAFIATPLLAVDTAEQQFSALAQLPVAELKGRAGDQVEVDIDLSTSLGFSVEINGQRAEVRYRMGFNQLTEGWSWRPLANPSVEDYYQFKFLPLQSVAVERAGYEHEDKIGVPQQMKVSWRYDYFLAFENIYDFYPRQVDDDAGFSAELDLADTAKLGMRAKATLIDPEISESTTFWKATYGKPVDFTLKKRYLIGKLTEVSFFDQDSGRTLCRIRPGQQGRCSGR